MNRTLIFAALPALFAGCATAADTASDKLAGFERTGKTENCLGLKQISEIKALSDEQLLVRVGNSEYYLNEVNGGCNNAGDAFTRLQYSTTLTQLCRGEIVSVVDNSTGATIGSCSLGDFERLEKKPAAN